MDYPKEACKDHPSRQWEWDGYTWVCVGCVVGASKEPVPINKAA